LHLRNNFNPYLREFTHAEQLQSLGNTCTTASITFAVSIESIVYHLCETPPASPWVTKSARSRMAGAALSTATEHSHYRDQQPHGGAL
jgi:hypothetical protein